MPEDQKQRPYEDGPWSGDPWSQFMFGGPQFGGQYGNPQSETANKKDGSQPNNTSTNTGSGTNPQMNQTIQSILGPFMTSDGNLDMNKVMSGVDHAMKMMNQFGPAMKQLGPILEMFSKKK